MRAAFDNPYPPPAPPRPRDRDPHGLSNTEVCPGCDGIDGTKYGSYRWNTNCAGCGGTGVVRRGPPPPPPRRASEGSEDYGPNLHPLRAISSWLARLRPKGNVAYTVPCEMCDGKGERYIPGHRGNDCPDCEGKGLVPANMRVLADKYRTHQWMNGA